MNIQSEIQNEVKKLWYENNCKGLACLATGSGKSKIFIDIVAEQKKPWLLVVPTEKLRDKGWKEEFEKWNKSDIYKKYVTVTCYASLKNEDLSKYQGVGLDECHRVSINNIQPFKEHHERLNIICLTATEPKDQEKLHILYNMIKCKKIYDLPLKKAIEIGIVAPLNIYIHELQLDSTKNIEVKYKDKKTGTERMFKTSELDSYNFMNKKLSLKIKPTQSDYIFRAKFIYDSKTKTEYAKRLLDSLPKNKRILIFSESTKQINQLLKETYHSKTDDKYYDLFVKEKINRLGVVKSLNEGENIPNLDIGIIVQLNSNGLNTWQRIGRIVRKRPDHIADIHFIILKNTVDEKWINGILEGYEELITRIKL